MGAAERTWWHSPGASVHSASWPPHATAGGCHLQSEMRSPGPRGASRLATVSASHPGRNARIARNEASYRELNEDIAAGGVDHRRGGDRLMLVCECGNEDCTRSMNVRTGDYEAVRANPRRFLVLSGHEIGGAERVVEDFGGLVVTEKHEDTADIVEARDPRS